MNENEKAIELCTKLERDIITLANDIKNDIEKIRDAVDKLEAEILSVKENKK